MWHSIPFHSTFVFFNAWNARKECLSRIFNFMHHIPLKHLEFNSKLESQHHWKWSDTQCHENTTCSFQVWCWLTLWFWLCFNYLRFNWTIIIGFYQFKMWSYNPFSNQLYYHIFWTCSNFTNFIDLLDISNFEHNSISISIDIQYSHIKLCEINQSIFGSVRN